MSSLLLALGLGFVILLALGYDPVEAYRQFLVGSFRGPGPFGNMLTKAIPLIMLGLSAAVAFRMSIWQIGQEGQMYLGALTGAAMALSLPKMPGLILQVSVLIAAAIAGGALAGLAGTLKAYLQVDEVVSTLMLQYIALLFTEYMVTHPLKNPTGAEQSTAPVPQDAWLGRVFPPSQLHTGIFLALLFVAVIWVLLFRTTWGTNMRIVGTNPRFAEAMGVRPERIIVQGMFLSGALAGTAGAVVVLGTQHNFAQDFSPGYGFIGITVALLGRLHPVGVLVMALVYGNFISNAAVMQLHTSVPAPFVSVLTGLIVLFLTARRKIVFNVGRRRLFFGGDSKEQPAT